MIEGAEEGEEEHKKRDKQDADLEELWQEKMASLEKVRTPRVIAVFCCSMAR